MEKECYLPGDTLSVDPIVTYTRRSPEAPYGVAGLYPELFRNRRALHFLGFSFSAEAKDVQALPDGIARLESDLGDNRLVILANSDYESVRLSALGLPTINFLAPHADRRSNLPATVQTRARAPPIRRRL